MTVSVCYITAFNHQYRNETLTAILQYTPPNTELIFLKNGINLPFTPPRGKILESIITLGIPEARQYCCDNATHDMILWIDDDITVCPDYIDNFLAPFLVDNDIAISGYEGAVTNDSFTTQWYVDPLEVEADYFDPPYAIRKSILDMLGGYDLNIGRYGCDNTDLCLRVIKADYKLFPIVNPGIVHWRESSKYAIGETRCDLFSETQKNIIYLQSKHRQDWRARYGMEKPPFMVRPELQFPRKMKRTSGPEIIRI
ncbi:MAG: glycosyltransferase family 2 protein [Bacteroidetes bacterium]|nr:glycosyltransferase family 2 protein [Bacteroidota bacterium]